MNKLRIFSTITLILSFTITSCKKLIEIPEPKTQVSSETVFSDFETANAAMLGLYSQMMSSELNMENGGLSVFGGILSDDLTLTSSNYQYDPFLNNALTSDNSTINYNFWTTSYTNIYQANSIIEGLQNATGLSSKQKNSLIGEARMVRSFYYFYLVNLFGPIPLITSKDYRENALISRTSIDSVYKFIKQDLTEAELLLPSDYSTQDKVRPISIVATALLARLDLYLGNWDAAINESTRVINSPGLVLTAASEIDNCFKTSSPEIIWQLPQAYVNDLNSVEGETFIPSSGSIPQFTVTQSLLNSFDTGDLRRDHWIDSTDIDGTMYYYPAKYKVQFDTDITENDVILRLAEQYLIRSEASLKLDKIFESVQDLNIIRERAGLNLIDGNISQQDLEKMIALENRHEYFAELGHRWLDLKRTGRINDVLSVEKAGSWKSDDALLPLPLKEIEKNKNLLQNPGY